MDKELFGKYLNNKCLPAELKEVFTWFKDEPGTLYDRRMVRQFWSKFSITGDQFEDQRFEMMLDNLHHRINLLPPVNQEKNDKQKYILKLTNILARAAAVLFIPLLIAAIYMWRGYGFERKYFTSGATGNIEIFSPVGSRTYIELPDGTGVHLNHGSKLSYPRRFSGKERKVILSGEGYFSVTKNSENPFSVYTDNMIVTAIGTEFNVMAYPEIAYMETTLAEGKLLIKRKTSYNKPEVLEEMNPGQHLHYIPRKSRYRITDENINKYISWKDGVLVFNNDPLEEIVLRLGRWYNVEFVIKNSLLNNYTYTATFVDETLIQVLDLLELATPVKYEITPRVKQTDGTFSKQKVILDLE